MLLVVLAGLILWNEFARRTKMGGAITFFVNQKYYTDAMARADVD